MGRFGLRSRPYGGGSCGDFDVDRDHRCCDADPELPRRACGTIQVSSGSRGACHLGAEPGYSARELKHRPEVRKRHRQAAVLKAQAGVKERNPTA